MTPEEAFEAAVQIMGGKARLADAIGTSRQNMQVWTTVPPKWAEAVIDAVHAARRAAITAPLPTLHDLCPDQFPKPRAAGRGAAFQHQTAKKPRKKRT